VKLLGLRNLRSFTHRFPTRFGSKSDFRAPTGRDVFAEVGVAKLLVVSAFIALIQPLEDTS